MDLKNARIDIRADTPPEDYKKLLEELKKIPLRSSIDQYVITVFKEVGEKIKIDIRPAVPHQDLLEGLCYNGSTIKSEEGLVGNLLLFDSFENDKLTLLYNNDFINHMVIYRHSYEKRLKDSWESSRKK